jgi:hypothetical protein
MEADFLTLFSFFLNRSKKVLAMNREENVPIMTPIIIKKEKLKIDLPPSITRDKRTTRVVRDVIIVLDNVLLSASLITSSRLCAFLTFRSDLILSKTIMVSFKE